MDKKTIVMTGGSPWGLTLTGGKDFGSHLQISKVTPGGKAMTNGVKVKEYILEINGEDTQGVTHHGAQQKIRNTGSTLTLTLSSVEPARSAYASAANTTTTAAAALVSSDVGSTSGGRPRPPPPPVNVDTPATPPTTTTRVPPPTSTAKPPPTKPVQHVQPVQPVQPVKSVKSSQPIQPVYISKEENEEDESDPIFQSPAFKKITPEAPSVLSPRFAQESFTTPPTNQMKNVTLQDGNTIKSSQRPPPPANTPTNFTTTSMKVSSNTGPTVAKPTPPPSVKRPPPPPSPSSVVSPAPPISPQQQTKVTNRQGICEACQQPIRGAYSSAMNKVWHQEHFICYRCRNPLTGGTFVFEDDKIFCDNCYENKVAQMCSFCRKPIVGPMINATNRYYHQQCFTCCRCRCDLSQQDGFNMENNNLFCSNCFSDSYGETCHGCGQKIGANELWVEALDRTWHPHCFVCSGCKRPLEGSKFYARLGKPWCGQC